jgi:dsRNA-specific ribonuclease
MNKSEKTGVTDIAQGLYIGKRDIHFKNLIKGILKGAHIYDKYIDIITSKESMELLGNAFTSETVDPINNYEIFEHLGDLSANKFISMYMFQRFPQLNHPRYVKIVARLKINYGSKQSLFEFARKLGFWNYISSSLEFRQKRMKSLLEDVFEAFLGTIEWIVDKYTQIIGSGFIIVYKILEYLFDDIDISLDYNKLYDAKTRLKELFDMYEEKIGVLQYQDEKDEINNIRYCKVYRISNPVFFVNKITGKEDKKKVLSGNKFLIGEGYAPLLKNAQQFAASKALSTLKKQGWEKPIDDIYIEVNSKNKYQPFILNDKWENGINELYYVKYKSKFNKRYQCTPVSMYCRHLCKKQISYCIRNGADLTIPDTYGLFPIDYIFTILKFNSDEIKKFMVCFKNKQVHISKTVFDMYISKYPEILTNMTYKLIEY